jgi:cytidylate kinase
MERKLVIAIDGPSGAGKSTLGKLLAKKYCLSYIDTGAMYRALALRAFDTGIDIEDNKALERFCSAVEMVYEEKSGKLKIVIDGIDYTNKIRTQRAGKLSSIISTKKTVRDYLVGYQKKLGEAGGVVMEGRDIGTVVLPDADLKFYLDASHETRGKRRFSELKQSKAEVNLADIMASEKERDARDLTRTLSPLRKASDSIYIDSGNFTISEVLNKMVMFVNKAFASKVAN